MIKLSNSIVLKTSLAVIFCVSTLECKYFANTAKQLDKEDLEESLKMDLSSKKLVIPSKAENPYEASKNFLHEKHIPQTVKWTPGSNSKLTIFKKSHKTRREQNTPPKIRDTPMTGYILSNAIQRWHSPREKKRSVRETNSKLDQQMENEDDDVGFDFDGEFDYKHTIRKVLPINTPNIKKKALKG